MTSTRKHITTIFGNTGQVGNNLFIIIITITWFERATWIFDGPRNSPRSWLSARGEPRADNHDRGLFQGPSKIQVARIRSCYYYYYYFPFNFNFWKCSQILLYTSDFTSLYLPTSYFIKKQIPLIPLRLIGWKRMGG